MSGGVEICLDLINSYRSSKQIQKHPDVKFSIKEAVDCADLYEVMIHDPENPAVRTSYEAFSEHLIDQFKLIQDLNFRFIPSEDHYGYKTSNDLRTDIVKGQMVYLPTASNNGSLNEICDDHPLSKIVDIGGISWVMNDIFRIVHDFYGHGTGHSFAPQGEHQAWLNHRSMLPQEALMALFCETRGQSSWINFGRHIRESVDYINLSERPFAPQKSGIVPPHFI
jgi:hypothetical protein